ncbi:MAG: anaerobic carbon-monoxide dehydrogenase catalytic subunit [Dehalococcoidia bacterium]|nr:anaerobic carbon-monoxide dehydrogenase catalytic subunit [Dehalococcoidia bacterium]
MTPKQATIDPASLEVLAKAEAENIPTAFSRALDMKPCPIGREGSCCSVCYMGPCRFVGKNAETMVGICGATHATITARNLARGIAAGASAHSDHGRDLAFALLAIAKGEAQGYGIKDEKKLRKMAGWMGIKSDGRTKEEVAEDVANKSLAQFGQQTGEIICASRATKKRQELWRKLGLIPRGIDREIVETLHRTGMGTDQDPDHILMQALRTSLTDGWGGAMLATDISDVIFGTPSPIQANSNLGVLKDDEVNIIVHGHEPLLSEMIVVAASEPESIEYAKSKGAKGINLAGMCCTANEILMRHGIPSAGNFSSQELAIITGAVDAMVVDVQCIMEALSSLSKRYHTKLITTSPKAKITGATHIQFDEHHALTSARLIVRTAIDNYPNRKAVAIPDIQSELIGGFSHEYINYALGGTYRGSFRPLNDAIMSGRIRGAVGVVGCNNFRCVQDEGHSYIVRELIKNDVLVVQTGCGAHANAKYGLLTPEAMEFAGPGLREVCEAVGIPPVLHLGSCVDNTRILTVLTQMAEEGGLGEDIDDLPAVGIAPEWMHEKALAIGAYFVASGAYVIFGVGSPVAGSKQIEQLISTGWEEKLGGKLEFEPDLVKIVEKTLAHIDKKRRALKLEEYRPDRYGQSGDARMLQELKEKA